MNTGEYYNAQDEASERLSRKRRNQGIDLAVNWLAFVLLSFAGFWVLLTDIDTYQSEKLYYRMLNDGVTVEETDPYMAKGMTRNLQFKGESITTFFIAKWKWRVPVYLLLIILPIFVAGYRAWRYNRVRLGWAYVATAALSFTYFIYFWGRMHGYW
ncbi:MAG TPA: hypothetical protein VHS96_09350 [Bacteroidia bacterium]|nr:hypothetical protein [Bacteroidia bacterium]